MHQRSTIQQATGLAGWLAVAFAAAAVGAVASVQAASFSIDTFWRVRPLAGILLLPYFAWVSFAGGLTWSVWQSNPGALG